MKIPEGYSITSEMWKAWHETAARLSLKHNIYIAVEREQAVDTHGNAYQTSLHFEVAEHRFDSLTDLLKALKLKAFL
jgi:hypothetical protein